MASEITKSSWVVLPILILVSNLVNWVNGIPQPPPPPQVPCYFVFGSSLSDDGNNNALVTLSKVNYPPYGIDFPAGPTGRFTNGRNLADILAEHLGFGGYFIPPFATAGGSEILKGVNYASGGSGIRNETGRRLGEIISLDMQLQNHQSIVKQIVIMRGNNASSAAEYLNKCIYTSDTGRNDYTTNYFVSMSNSSRQYTPDQYAKVLIDQYSQQLRMMYNLGARKIVLFGLGRLGSIPYQLAMCNTSGSSCQTNTINSAVQLFNSRLISLVQDLNRNLIDAKFIYIDYYGIESSYTSHGSLNTNSSCCSVSQNLVACNPNEAPCKNRTEYVFWDGVHPTEATFAAIVGRAYKAKFPTDAFPYDINRLAQLC